MPCVGRADFYGVLAMASVQKAMRPSFTFLALP